ncbi:MAG: DUF4296 domain-containing protein [Bacteroidales bacterium]|nr:DUF4296 domain-containing protein [Bacteroidales bacterium]
MQKFKSLITIITLVFSIAACGIISSDNPCRKHVEKKVMVDLLTEVFLLEAHVSHQQTMTNIRDSLTHLYGGLFQKYEVTADEFEKAFECYMLDRDLMNSVLDEVLSNISIARSKADEKKEAESDDLPPENQ